MLTTLYLSYVLKLGLINDCIYTHVKSDTYGINELAEMKEKIAESFDINLTSISIVQTNKFS